MGQVGDPEGECARSPRSALRSPPRSALRPALRAAFHGRPADAVALLRGCGQGGADAPVPARWLLGVSLGALGNYRQAQEVLLPDGTLGESLCASTRASHLRQLGDHASAEILDRVAAERAADAARPQTALADALVGLVADAVGRGDGAEAASRLEAARRCVAELPESAYWRAHVRLGWVHAETCLVHGRPDAAHAAGLDALERARAAAAPRHETKSLLVVGVAAHLVGRSDAVRTLAAAAEAADDLGLTPLVWPARLVLSRALEDRGDPAARRERAAARAAVGTIAASLPAPDAARFLAGEGPASL